MGERCKYNGGHNYNRDLVDYVADKEVITICPEVLAGLPTPREPVELVDGHVLDGIKVIIAGAGGAAHLPGMVAAKTTLPVIGVPVKSRALSGLDSLYSIVQMPGGVPVATMAIGESGAKNAALTALRILAIEDAALAEKLEKFAIEQGKSAEESTDELD